VTEHRFVVITAAGRQVLTSVESRGAAIRSAERIAKRCHALVTVNAGGELVFIAHPPNNPPPEPPTGSRMSVPQPFELINAVASVA
jgi:hypothetical protein